MVEIEIAGEKAVAMGREWESGDPGLLRTLRQDAAVREWQKYDPFPALTLAMEAIQRYGGQIIRQEAPEHVKGRVY